MKTTRLIVLATSLIFAGAAAATAQTPNPKAYAELNVAGQTSSSTVGSSSTFSLFGETGSTSFSQSVGKGLLFDAGGGFFFRKNLAIGVALSLFSRSPAATVAVSTPDPIAFNAFAVTTSNPNLKHTELSGHLKFSYLVPITEKMSVTVFAGPSLVRLTKEIATASIVNGAAQIATASQSGTGFGAHGGADFTYLFTPQVGVGIFVRYVGVAVDLPAASAVPVGGFQGGLGLRVRF